jgi:hypothetical protein
MEYYGSINTIIGQAVLSCPMEENDAEAKTVGDYLRKLLKLVWHDEEGFDGKRPFGNSGWQTEVYKALIKADLVSGHLDSDGDIEYADEQGMDRLIYLAIESM